MEEFRANLSHQWADFKVFMWNKETKEFAGRTSKSWAEIGLFYLVFYVLLGCWWSLHLYVATSLLPEVSEGPKYTDYLAHRGPGLHIVPSPNANNADNQRVYDYNDRTELLDSIHNFIDERKDKEEFESLYGDCSKNINQTYEDYKPCFFFYLNAVHGFVPEPADNGTVTMQCKGSKKRDEQYLGDFMYFPERGFDTSKFPWKYGDEWEKMAPLMAVRVDLANDVQNSDVEVRIVCSVNAKNIHLDKEKPNIGSVDFRIQNRK